ncbi:MAG: sigma-70 family RNA polymerase sigma factor [Cyclobacteriaceae bacterium]|nr:sigma-70 family RNA polymerase sigma factor [Cyclobacteriaceae bacterium HetDA_MAG_MS6]
MSNSLRMEDKVLVEQVLSKDRQALKLLIEKYQRLVHSIVFRLMDDARDREEVAQDVFIKVYEKLPNFNFQSKLSTWIATIAYRHSVNCLRKRKRLGNEEDLEKVDFSIGYEDKAFENSDYSEFINTVVNKLPTKYRAMIVLYHMEGLSYPEIVEVMGMPEGTVKNYLFRARKKLRDLLAPYIDKEILM